MKKIYKAYIFGTLFFCVSSFYAQNDWKLAKESDGIKVYTMPSEKSKFDQNKGVVILDASVEDFIAAIHDLEHFKEWGYKVKSVDVLERYGDTLQIYYSVAKVPFPYKDRDGTYANRFKWNASQKTLEVSIEVMEDYLELKSDLVRVEGSGKWIVKELSENKIEVTLQMEINPGGSIPAWLSNMFVEDSPYITLKNLREKIKEEKYQNKTYSFIN